MDFYGIVLIVAIVVFILVLILMGLMLTNGKSTHAYPPTSNDCPDYWILDSTGNCQVPTSTNSVNTGIYNATNKPTSDLIAPYVNTQTTGWSFDPTNTKWLSTGKTKTCAQKDWATQYNIMWDGVSNYNSC